MSTEYSPFARPTFTAADFARDEPYNGERRPARTAEPRSFSVEHSFDEPSKTEEQPVFAGTPIYAGSTRTKSSGRSIRPALMIGVPAVVLAAGVAYFAMQPRQTIFADPVPATAAVEPLAPPATPGPTQLAAAEPAAVMPEVPAAPAVTAAQAARTEAPARVARARPAPQAQDASSFAADAGATMPAAPIPYSSLGQTSAPAPAAAAPSIIVPPMSPPTPADAAPAPAEAAPAPEPAISDPAAATPPTTPEPPTP